MSEEIEALEMRLWTAGADAFADLMGEDGVLVVPRADGIMDKPRVLEMLAGAPAPEAVSFADEVHRDLGADHHAFTYSADARYGGRSLRVLNTSIWRKHDEGWRLALHQQTPSPDSEL